MTGASDKSTSRAAVLFALVGLVAVALRGTLPGSDRVINRPHPISNTAALAIVVALLAVALAILTVATVARIRNPPAALPLAAVHADWGRGGADTGVAVLADCRDGIAVTSALRAACVRVDYDVRHIQCAKDEMVTP